MEEKNTELTPMRKQYYTIKEQNKDCILFFRLGDFYEMFDEDARLAARELGKITGHIEVDEILDKIFGSFCIGK